MQHLLSTISIRQIEAFLAVIHYGSASAAADKMKISQPAVSRSIQQLEEHLGTPLFNRISGKFLPNEMGRLLIPKAHAFLAMAHDIQEEIGSLSGNPTGIIHTGASTTIASTIMPGIIGTYKSENPHVSINLQVGNFSSILNKLIDYEIDVAFLAGSLHHYKIDAKPWALDELVVVCSPKHSLANCDALRPEVFRNQKWIVRESGSGSRDLLIDSLAKHNIPILIEYELGSNGAVRRGVVDNLGLGCMSRTIVADDIERGILIELSTPFFALSRMYYIATLKDRIPTRVLDSFIDYAFSYKRVSTGNDFSGF